MTGNETEREWLANRFEAHRPHLRSVAYRMLGSISEADDAVQEAWLRIGSAAPDEIENFSGWLTTVTARLCVNTLRARRQLQSFEVYVPDPVADNPERGRPEEPEEEALLAHSVGLALLVVLETLSPAERLVFVLRDVFDLPFEEIAVLVDRSSATTRQLASRARRKVNGAGVPVENMTLVQQRAIVEAFLAAAREGDFDRLVTLLDPDVIMRIDRDIALVSSSMMIRGADEVSRQATRGLRGGLSLPGTDLRAALVNGAAGVVILVAGDPTTVIGFTVASGVIVEIDAISARDRLPTIAAAILIDGQDETYSAS